MIKLCYKCVCVYIYNDIVCVCVQEPQLYFTDPQQLLDLLTELEKQNLNLIQNTQDTEESLQEFRITMDNTRKKMSVASLLLMCL